MPVQGRLEAGGSQHAVLAGQIKIGLSGRICSRPVSMARLWQPWTLHPGHQLGHQLRSPACLAIIEAGACPLPRDWKGAHHRQGCSRAQRQAARPHGQSRSTPPHLTVPWPSINTISRSTFHDCPLALPQPVNPKPCKPCTLNPCPPSCWAARAPPGTTSAPGPPSQAACQGCGGP